MCENLGVDLKTQLEKLRRAPWACMGQSPTHDSSGRVQQMTMLALRSVPAWLASIDVDRVSPHVREKLVRYQLEAADDARRP